MKFAFIMSEILDFAYLLLIQAVSQLVWKDMSKWKENRIADISQLHPKKKCGEFHFF